MSTEITEKLNSGTQLINLVLFLSLDDAFDP